MNILTATGNLGRDCEVRFMADATPVGSFSFALSSGYGKSAKTTWLDCSIFGKRAETLAPMLSKGTQIAITGEFSIREYNDKDGNLKSVPSLRVNDITLLGKKGDAPAPLEVAQVKDLPKSNVPDFDAFEDDVPF
jgi:single-strand DNA-binding protein